LKVSYFETDIAKISALCQFMKLTSENWRNLSLIR